MDGDKVYSPNGEDQWGSCGCPNCYDLQVGDTIYEGTAMTPDVSRLVDADDIIDMLAGRAYDNHGEFAEDFSDLCRKGEAKRELDEFLQQWITKHCNVNFYSVVNVTERVLTQEDFE